MIQYCNVLYEFSKVRNWLIHFEIIKCPVSKLIGAGPNHIISGAMIVLETFVCKNNMPLYFACASWWLD